MKELGFLDENHLEINESSRKPMFHHSTLDLYRGGGKVTKRHTSAAKQVISEIKLGSFVERHTF